MQTKDKRSTVIAYVLAIAIVGACALISLARESAEKSSETKPAPTTAQ
jgi:hypothetical protein